MKVNIKRSILVVAGIVSICMIVFLVYSSVDNSLSEEDRQYISKFLINIERLSENPTYKDELNFITAVQKTVLNIASKNDALPFGQKREPKELYLAKTGVCFDRSRVIEKILRYSGFDTRHFSIYSTKETGSAIMSLITPNTRSHAATEVLTKKGWLVVDSNEPFVSIDNKNQPISLKHIQLAAEGSISIQWHREMQIDIYKQPFLFLYGLYSRHGQFYPPYNFVPDINYSEFMQNIL